MHLVYNEGKLKLYKGEQFSYKHLFLFTNSIQTLVKISKTAGPRLKPHASRLIPALLEALSTLEPQVLNYLSLRATEQEKVSTDSATLSSKSTLL